ncbi:MAG TPA: hypothetical protein VNL91_05270, partial [Thermoanaerobaculia bacterium]|nr:hypothetical protein [Thermoanaerobaculia bacterium]
MDSLLFVAPNSWVIRNWITTGLADLAAGQLGVEPVFTSPFAISEFSSPTGRRFRNLTIPADAGRADVPAGFPRLLYVMYYLRLRTFAQEVENGSIQMMMLSRRRDAVHYVIRAIRTLLPRGSRRRAVARKIVDAINPVHEPTGRIFDEVRPVAVVVGSPGFLFFDQTAMIEARRRGIPVHCVVNSWDNMTSRGSMIRRPETLMVWNEYMKEQAREIHDYPPESTHVVGSLQFSRYREPLAAADHESVRRRLGLPPDEEYFLFLTGQHVPDYEAEDVAKLLEVLERSEFAHVTLVVRVHPQAPDAPFKAITHPRLIVDVPPKFSTNEAGSWFDVSDMKAMAALLTEAKAVFSSWGTTALLEAAIFDRPIIQLRWMDAFWRVNRDQAVRVHDFQKYLHLVPFDASGCRLFSDSPESFLEDLKLALAHPRSLAEGRIRAVESLATPPLDAAPSRVVEVLRGALGSSRRSDAAGGV